MDVASAAGAPVISQPEVTATPDDVGSTQQTAASRFPLSGTAMLISAGPSPHPCSRLSCSLYLVSRALLPVWPFADLPFPPNFEIHNFHGTVVCGTAVVLLGVCWQVTHEGSGPRSSQLSSPASASKSISRPPLESPRAFL